MSTSIAPGKCAGSQLQRGKYRLSADRRGRSSGRSNQLYSGSKARALIRCARKVRTPHSINVDAANRFAFAADLGLDKVFIFRLDPAAAKLTPNNPAWVALPPGSGPRHFAFHPNGRFAYVINEMKSTITAMRHDAQRGALTPLATVSTLPGGFTGNNTTADVHVHPSGKFLYGSNRGHDSIAMFAIDETTGIPRYLGVEPTQGKNPRNFAVDPTGSYLLAANQDGNNIVVFSIDSGSGKLHPTGNSLKVPAPVCVKFMR